MGLTTMKVACVSAFSKIFGAVSLFVGVGFMSTARVFGVVGRDDFERSQLVGEA